MAKQDNTNDTKQNINELIKLNNTFNDTLSQLSTSITGLSNTHNKELERLNKEVGKIINAELTDTKSITSDDMATFIIKLFNDIDNKAKTENKSLDDIFESDSGGLFQFFQQRYQNKNLLFEDLEVISSQLFELEEAIMTTRDAIITSDDIATTVSRTLRFNNAIGDDCEDYINTVREMENRLRLLVKIKNLIVPNTLRYGTYYVYCCPYSKLFQEQYDRKIKDPLRSYSVKESIDPEFISDLTEEFKSKNISIGLENMTKNKFDEKLTDTIKGYTENIEIINDTVSIPLLEGIDLTELIDNNEFTKIRDKAIKKTAPTTVGADGTLDTGDGKSKKNDFRDVTGCYIKYISPKKIIPVKILETTVGYYYIHDTDFQVNKSPFSTTIRVTDMTSGNNYQNTEDVESIFLNKITNRIVKSFDKKFLEDNMQFKDLIFNALLYNNLYKKQIKFQFIPADYIVEFKVNEDADGNGQSILNKALFYAKLYLALLIFKMVSIVSRSNDQRIYYVKNSGIDANITNKIQEVARSVKSRQINFMDLLNYNSIISKIGAFKEIFIPKPDGAYCSNII